MPLAWVRVMILPTSASMALPAGMVGAAASRPRKLSDDDYQPRKYRCHHSVLLFRSVVPVLEASWFGRTLQQTFPGLHLIDTVGDAQRYFGCSSRSVNLSHVVRAVPLLDQPTYVPIVTEPPFDFSRLIIRRLPFEHATARDVLRNIQHNDGGLRHVAFRKPPIERAGLTIAAGISVENEAAPRVRAQQAGQHEVICGTIRQEFAGCQG